MNKIQDYYFEEINISDKLAYSFMPYDDDYNHGGIQCRCNPYVIYITGYVKRSNMLEAFIKFIKNDEFNIPKNWHDGKRMFNVKNIDKYIPVKMKVYVHNVGKISFTKSNIKGEE